jgi:hypothetical protein
MAVRLEGRLVGRRDEPLLFRREGDRLLWVPPPDLRGDLPASVLDVTDAAERARLRTLIRHTESGTDFVIPSRHALELVPVRGGLVTPVVRTTARIEPEGAAAGSTPEPGDWEMVSALTVCGFSATGRVRSRRTSAAYRVTFGQDGRVRTRRGAALSAFGGRAARAMPAVARVVRRARERRAAAASH